MNKENKEYKISAIKNGTVIDHINSENTLDVVKILDLHGEQMMIGVAFDSGKFGKKGVIKISDKELSSDEINKIALVAPNATILIIKNYEIKRKNNVEVPDEFVSIAKCKNINCVTNHQEINTHFYTIATNPIRLKCKYCEKIFKNDVELL